jgi:hypothetical protein
MSIYNVTFEFENSNGRLYSVTMNKKTGVGYGIPLAQGGIAKGRADNSLLGKTRVALAVDASFLAALPNRSTPYLMCAPIYNTAKTLNTVLNGAA